MRTLYFVNSQHIIPPFLNNEIKEASIYFDNVVLISPLFKNKNLHISLPSNVKIFYISRFSFYFNAFRSLFRFKPLFYLNDKKKVKKDGLYSFKYLKMSFTEYANAYLIKHSIEKQYKKFGSGIFVSAWFDASALAISLFSDKKNIKKSCFSFCHSFEVDKTRNPYVNYLFFDFIIPHFSKIFFISKNVLDRYFNYCDKTNFYIDKQCFDIRYLGIMNDLEHRILPFDKKESLLIISCSTMNKVKRISLIVDSLKNITIPIRWIHFGGGPLYDNLLLKAKSELPSNIQWEFKGMVTNKKVIDFYNEHANEIALFINLSSSEGIPVSIMEAMSYGIPCLATDVGGTNELVNNDNGFLVSSSSSADDISKIIENVDTTNKDYLKKRENSYFKVYNDFNGKENAKLFYSNLINDYEKNS